ncbi:type II secretion system F family protein [Catenulispora rubra]|uniref:type II secretion system F family protein n=1 Tax=Catenulispora rubra TaxID=280293 RepID=UPI0018927D34|nr:type II secretion system F family protein [Catenulispora rubra]
MTAALICGAGFGLALAALIYGLFPPKPTLAEAMSALSTNSAPAPILGADDEGWLARAGAPLGVFLAGLGLPGTRVRKDLMVLERSVPAYLAEKAMLGVLGLSAPLVLAGLLQAAGMPLGWMLSVWVSLAFAAAAFIAPDYGLRAEAAARREEFTHALSAFLDLVTISLTAGGGIEAALKEASLVGDGWAFVALRKALATAEISRVAPWTTLAQLGAELDVPALGELATSLALAGSEGAKVRASLAAKAGTLRAAGLAKAEGYANAATERMSLPLMVMAMGFLIMIGYPAMAHVMSGL